MNQKRYDTRPTSNGKHIDIIHAGAGKGSGYVCRVTLRDGMQEHGKKTAAWICALMNESAIESMGEAA